MIEEVLIDMLVNESCQTDCQMFVSVPGSPNDPFLYMLFVSDLGNICFDISRRLPDLGAEMMSQQFPFPSCARKGIGALELSCQSIKHTITSLLLCSPQARNFLSVRLSNSIQET